MFSPRGAGHGAPPKFGALTAALANGSKHRQESAV